MLDWEITLLRGENGFYARWLEELDNGNVAQKHMFFQEFGIDNYDSHVALAECMRFVTEHFGLLGSKHDEKRISIELTDERKKSKLGV